MIARMTRCWINQPSTLQPDHKLHGKRGLVNLAESRSSRKGDIVRIWFSGEGIQSTEVFRASLSLDVNDVEFYARTKVNHKI